MPLPRLAVLVGLIVATAATAAPTAPFAYVTNSGSASVSVADIATNAVSGTPIPVRGIPGGVLVTADATRVYGFSSTTRLTLSPVGSIPTGSRA